MRALDSRRPRLTTTFHLVPRRRSFLLLPLLLLLLLFAGHGTEARTVPRDEPEAARPSESSLSGPEEISDPRVERVKLTDREEDTVPEQVQRKNLVPVEDPEDARLEDEENERDLLAERDAGDTADPRLERKTEEEEVTEDPGIEAARNDRAEENITGEGGLNTDVEQNNEALRREDEDGTVKKRRRNEAVLSGKSEGQNGAGGLPEEGDEGIRRFDAEVETEEEIEQLGRRKAIDEVLSSDHRSDEKELEISGPNEDAGLTEEAEGFGKDQEKSEETVRLRTTEEVQNELKNLESLRLNDQFQKEENLPDGKPTEENPEAYREYRQLESPGKSRFKSSTVYLSAEEKNTPDREQESIVNGQIKKLISIRDDVLDAANERVQPEETLEEAKLLNAERVMRIDEVTFQNEKDEYRNERSTRFRDIDQNYRPASSNLLLKWKNQATMLQDQIRNKTFVQRLREQATEVLPEIPKFTENQLLDTLRQIVSSRKPDLSSESYANKLSDPTLSANQLEIIKCAEQLVSVKQRQTFVTNMVDCIRSLSVLNCMRIFVWPIVADNLPESISQNLSNLPIEINLIDLFQGNRGKSARSQDFHRVRLLTPESVVYSILKDTLEMNPSDNALPTFIDSKNETLKKLLTSGQVEILQMAEKFLPEAVRKEYSDRMFSCVRRFEYFSCVKYFAWPMVKQYFPALPAFPDYQNWYPTIALFPEYPILPFPSFSQDEAELPEVVDADATRMRKPRPEAVIVHILRNALKEQARVPNAPSFLDHSTDSYVALIPQDQLLTVHMAEQLLPVSYRPEFVQKTIRCIQEINYLTCIKYSTWPMIRQYYPSLPDWANFTSYFPDVQLPEFPDVVGYFPDIGSYFPWGGVPPVEPPPEAEYAASILRKNAPASFDDIESKIAEILLKVRKSVLKEAEASAPIIGGNVVILTTITDKQVEILRLAESILPPPVRATLVTQVLSCLQRSNDFVNCTRYIIWPSLTPYAPNLPEFPKMDSKKFSYLPPRGTYERTSAPLNPQEQLQERVVPENMESSKISSRTPYQGEQSRNKAHPGPVISVTGTRFVPIFTEHPESVIFNILRSVQLESPIVNRETVTSTRTQQFVEILNEQQENIIRITETLLPDEIRPVFVNRMIDCVRESNFLVCSRDVLWPTVLEYFPRLPSFPNFGILSATTNNATSPSTGQNLTESSSENHGTRPLAETNVKTGQHGDATITITDTRFYPIFNELPESVILNILKAVQLSTPNLPTAPTTSKTQDLSAYLTGQQANIVQIAESLLPLSVRPAFVEKMISCVRDNNFLDCTRDIAWPTVAQFFPRLPNFPNFGSFQNVPRTRLQVLLEEPAMSPELKGQISTTDLLREKETIMKKIEERLENVLTKALSQEVRPRLDHSYLNINDPAVSSLLTGSQMNIIRLVEKGIPDSVRKVYVTRMLECVKDSNFITCTQQISWPTLKQFYPSVGSFPNLDDLLGQLPQAPDLGQLPTFPDLGQYPSIPGVGSPFQDIPNIQYPQLPGGIQQFPGGIQQFPGGVQQLPGGIQQFPGAIQQFPGTIQQFPGAIQQFPGAIPQFPGAPSQLPAGISQFPGFPQVFHSTLSRSTQEETPPHQPVVVFPQAMKEAEAGRFPSSASTSSVGDPGIVPEYAGQPTKILVDISDERVQVSDDKKKQPSTDTAESNSMTNNNRKKRNVDEKLFNSYYDTSDMTEEGSSGQMTFPNFTETEFLQLLVNLTKSKSSNGESTGDPKVYYVDTLNSTIRKSLTADQYEILKIVEDLNEQTSSRGFLSRVIQCIRGLSFIRCMGIFVWPIITNNIPSLIGLPSLPSVPSIPGIGLFGRSTETAVEQFFGMSTTEFEKEMLARKESIETFLLDWYKKLGEDKFQTKVGFLKIRGYGNGELGVSFAGFREGRGTKIKDNKNLPSILTIISDIMEEVLDQRPDNERVKKDKEKKERSLQDSGEASFQLLKDAEELVDIKRSINDDEIITMFLNKIKSNISESGDADVKQYLNLEDAYSAFEVLFGTRLNGKLANRLKTFNEDRLKSFHETNRNEPIKQLDIVSLESQKDTDELKVLPLNSEVAYDLERESLKDQEEQQRQKRAKSFFKSFIDKYSDRYLKDTRVEKFEDEVENTIRNGDKPYRKDSQSELIIRLPSLDKNLTTRKSTSSEFLLTRGFKLKMTQMLPGISLVLSFMLQLALAHARAAASMAGMLSNMAMGSAMFGMIRDAIFGQNASPKIKYVYDNDKVGPGVLWPQDYGANYHG